MNTFDPIKKLLFAAVILSAVALPAAGYRISINVANGGIYSVQSAVSIGTVSPSTSKSPRALTNSSGSLPTVIALRTCQSSDLLLGEPKFDTTHCGPVDKANVKHVETRLARPFSFAVGEPPGLFTVQTSTASGAAPHRDDLPSAIAFEAKTPRALMAKDRRVFVLRNLFDNDKTADTRAGNNNQFSHTTLLYQ
jgi:hypothetical protein